MVYTVITNANGVIIAVYSKPVADTGDIVVSPQTANNIMVGVTKLSDITTE